MSNILLLTIPEASLFFNKKASGTYAQLVLPYGRSGVKPATLLDEILGLRPIPGAGDPMVLVVRWPDNDSLCSVAVVKITVHNLGQPPFTQHNVISVYRNGEKEMRFSSLSPFAFITENHQHTAAVMHMVREDAAELAAFQQRQADKSAASKEASDKKEAEKAAKAAAKLSTMTPAQLANMAMGQAAKAAAIAKKAAAVAASK